MHAPALIPGTPLAPLDRVRRLAYRVLLAAGVLGLAALAGWWVAFRRRSSALPHDLEPILATAAFGLAAVVLYGQSTLSLTEGLHHGAGQWLTAALVSTAYAAWFARRAWRGVAVRSPLRTATSERSA